MRTIWRMAAIVFCSASISLVACQDDDSGEPPHLVIDSAGQHHVTLMRLEQFSAPQARLNEVYRTNEHATPVEFFRVTGARFLEHGRLAVGNNGSQEILVLDSEGGLEKRIGRAGEGPGEFRDITNLDIDADGALTVYDARIRRLTTFGPGGVFSGDRRLFSPTPLVRLRPLAVMADGRLFGINWDSGDFTVLGVRRDSTPLFMFDPSGVVVDTLRVWPAQEWNFATLADGRGTMKNELGFGRTLAHAGRNGYAALGSTDSLAIAVYGLDGRVIMTVRGSGGTDRVELAELQRWQAEREKDASDARDFMRTAILETPHRETYPAFGSLHLDDQHRLWIGAYRRPGQTEQKYVVLGSNGRLWGVVEVPAGGQVLDVAADKIAILRSTDWDEEFIEVLGVQWPS